MPSVVTDLVRKRDGAIKQCPNHPAAALAHGRTRSGQPKTWCTECGHLAAWVEQNEKEDRT